MNASGDERTRAECRILFRRLPDHVRNQAASYARQVGVEKWLQERRRCHLGISTEVTDAEIEDELRRMKLPPQDASATEPVKPTRRPNNRPGQVRRADSTFNLTKGGYYRMPNDVADELLASLPGSVLKAYVLA